MPYAVGDRVLIRVEQESGDPVYVPGTVSTVSDETPYGVTLDGDDVESTWYVESELAAAPASAEEPAAPEPDDTAVATARRGTRKLDRQPNAAAVRADATRRIKAIVKSDEAAGREALAEHFAYDTSMSVSEARAALAKSPKAEASKPAAATLNRFDAAMAAAGNPQVGLEDGASQDEGLAYADSYFAAKRQKRSA